jgi:hypothetical protein
MDRIVEAALEQNSRTEANKIAQKTDCAQQEALTNRRPSADAHANHPAGKQTARACTESCTCALRLRAPPRIRVLSGLESLKSVI